MRSRENLRLIVKIRKFYRIACDVALCLTWQLPTTPTISNAAMQNANVPSPVVTTATIQKTMSSSVLFAGLAGLFTLLAAIFGFFAWGISWKEGKAKDTEAARLSDENRAKFAVLEATASNAKSAQQTVEVELNKAKIELAQTQRQIAPRHLGFEGKAYLINLLKDVPKSGYVYVTRYDRLDFEGPGDQEAWDLMAEIAFVMEQAGLPRNPTRADRDTQAGPKSKFNVGIEFQRHFPTLRKPDPMWLPVFVKGMADLGFEVHDGIGNFNCPPDCIVIEVGAKPKYPGQRY